MSKKDRIEALGRLLNLSAAITDGKGVRVRGGEEVFICCYC